MWGFDLYKQVIVEGFPEYEVANPLPSTLPEGQFRPHSIMRWTQELRMVLQELVGRLFWPCQKRLKFLDECTIAFPSSAPAVETAESRGREIPLNDCSEDVQFSPRGRIFWLPIPLVEPRVNFDSLPSDWKPHAAVNNEVISIGLHEFRRLFGRCDISTQLKVKFT